MKMNSSLSGILHVLLHMAEAQRPLTSETMAKAMRTNPAVIRRIMGGLRDSGLVQSEKGHGGGWTLQKEITAVTLCDVYMALGSPGLFALGHRTEAPDCLVEQAVNAALGSAFREAETLLLRTLSSVTLGDLREDFHSRLLAAGLSEDMEDIYAL